MQRKRLLPVLLLAFLLAILPLAGCGKTTTPPVDEQKTYTFDGEVVIGYSGPLSGAAAIYGQGCLDALLMAADDANAEGGVVIEDKRYSIKVVGLDDEYRPDMAAANARRLVEQYDVSTIFCVHAGGILAMQQFNQDEGFLIGGYTTFDRIVQTGNSLTFRLAPPMAAYYSPMADWAYKVKGYQRAALLPADNLYGVTWRDGFKAKFESLGGDVVYSADLDYNSGDFYGSLTPALATNPDVILVIGPSEPSSILVTQARELGYKGGFVFGEQVTIDDMIQFAGIKPLANSIALAPAGRTYYENDVQEAFSARFIEKFPKYPSVNTQHQINYEALWYVIKSMEIADSVTDATAIRAAMPEAFPVAQHVSVRGAIAEDGSVLGITALLEIDENGEFGDSYMIDRVDGYDIDFANAVPWKVRTAVSPWRLQFEEKYLK